MKDVFISYKREDQAQRTAEDRSLRAPLALEENATLGRKRISAWRARPTRSRRLGRGGRGGRGRARSGRSGWSPSQGACVPARGATLLARRDLRRCLHYSL